MHMQTYIHTYIGIGTHADYICTYIYLHICTHTHIYIKSTCTCTFFKLMTGKKLFIE